MRIGVDARLLSENLTGVGRYTFELSKRLAQIPNLESFYYSPASVGYGVSQSLQPGILKLASSRNRLSKMVWAQTKLPYWATKNNVDIFWAPTHRLPRFLPKSIARVVTIHDLVWTYAPLTMRPLSLFVEKRLMPQAIELADLVMADSQSTVNGIAEVFPQFSHKVRMVHLGASKPQRPDNTKALLELNIHKPFFLFVGTIEPRKNLERLLSAFALLPRPIRDQFSLVMAGGKGWGGVNLEKLIYEKKLTDSVKLLGYVSDQQLAALYSNARFLVMPSLYEGFGLPLVEAMQYGTPVLTSYGGSMAEIAGNGGVLVDPYSVESISTSIQQMLIDDQFMEALTKNARRRAQDFSWDKCATETIEVFEEAIALRDIRMSRS
ncbi:glycosyltransferase family 4 protein [Polynucleobacter asymbioticus]|nr:glycosyltransferase family 4 protein [Polynucleobacter asymbioticus]